MRALLYLGIKIVYGMSLVLWYEYVGVCCSKVGDTLAVFSVCFPCIDSIQLFYMQHLVLVHVSQSHPSLSASLTMMMLMSHPYFWTPLDVRSVFLLLVAALRAGR